MAQEGRRGKAHNARVSNWLQDSRQSLLGFKGYTSDTTCLLDAFGIHFPVGAGGRGQRNPRVTVTGADLARGYCHLASAKDSRGRTDDLEILYSFLR